MKFRYKIIICIGFFALTLSNPVRGIYRRSPERIPYYHYIMGRIYMHQGKITKAIESLEKAVELDTDSWIVRWDLLELYYITGEYYKGRDLAVKMYGMKPEDTHLLELMADIYAKTKEIDKSLDIYSKLLRLNPKNKLLHLSIASLYETRKDFKSAIKQYLTLLKKDPRNLYARLALADVYLELKEYKVASKNYLEALKYGANSQEIYLQVARVYNHLGKHHLAEKYLNKNLKTNPNDLQTLYLLAEVYQDAHRFKQAETVLANIRELTGDNVGVLLKLGTLYSEMNEIDKAAGVFKEVTREYPAEFTGWYLLGLTYEFQEKYGPAEKALLEAFQIKEDKQILFHLGVVYDKLKNQEKAYEKFEECLQMDPEHPGAHNYLGYTWAEKGINLDKAEQYVLNALKVDPENAAYIDSLGWVYYKQKKYEDALQKLKKAAGLSTDPIIIEHLGDAYLKLDNKNKAVKIYKKALKQDPENKELKKKIEELNK